jgi:hypothetical protein
VSATHLFPRYFLGTLRAVGLATVVAAKQMLAEFPSRVLRLALAEVICQTLPDQLGARHSLCLGQRGDSSFQGFVEAK